MRPQSRPERLPLSYAQQRLWFIDQLEGTSTEYNMPAALRLRGELDLEALERTIQAIVARHESLRTHFATVDGRAGAGHRAGVADRAAGGGPERLDEADAAQARSTAARAAEGSSRSTWRGATAAGEAAAGWASRSTCCC